MRKTTLQSLSALAGRAHHFRAPLAKIRKFGLHTDGDPVSPATRTFRVRCPRQSGTGFRAFDDGELAQNEKLFELWNLSLERTAEIRVSKLQRDRCLQGIADQLLFSRLFNLLTDQGAQPE